MRVKTLALAVIVLVNMVGIASTARAAIDPEVWIGAPFDARWASSDGCPEAFPSYSCSEPQYHSVDYASFDGTPLARSWSADIGGGSVVKGTQVVLYVAPQDAAIPVTTKVDKIGSACQPGHGTAGQVIVIGIYSGTTKLGTIAYAHVVPSVSQGQTINR